MKLPIASAKNGLGSALPFDARGGQIQVFAPHDQITGTEISALPGTVFSPLTDATVSYNGGNPVNITAGEILGVPNIEASRNLFSDYAEMTFDPATAIRVAGKAVSGFAAYFSNVGVPVDFTKGEDLVIPLTAAANGAGSGSLIYSGTFGQLTVPGSANEVRIPAHLFPTANQVHNVEVTLKVENDSGGHKRIEKIQMKPTPNDNLVTGIQVGSGLDGLGESLYGFHDNDDYTVQDLEFGTVKTPRIAGRELIRITCKSAIDNTAGNITIEFKHKGQILGSDTLEVTIAGTTQTFTWQKHNTRYVGANTTIRDAIVAANGTQAVLDVTFAVA